MTGIDGGLRQIMRSKLPDFFWTTVENGACNPSTPDSHYLLSGTSGWIEHKQTEGSMISSLKPEQAAWLDRYARYGGVSWLACRRWHDGGPRRGPPIDELWLVPGAHARAVFSCGLLALPTQHRFVWGGGPARWDWDAVRARLLGVARTGRSRTPGSAAGAGGAKAPGRGGRP